MWSNAPEDEFHIGKTFDRSVLKVLPGLAQRAPSYALNLINKLSNLSSIIIFSQLKHSIRAIIANKAKVFGEFRS